MSQEMENVSKLLGKPAEFRVGDRVTDIYPVRLRDWPLFSENLFVLRLETLQEVYKYIDAPEALERLFRVVTRMEMTHELFYDITEDDYEQFRSTVMGQNDINFNEDKTGKDSKN